MKKQYPSTLFQSICLLLIGFLFLLPFIFIGNSIQLLSTNEIYQLGYYITYCLTVVLIAMIVNKKNGIHVFFINRFIINQDLFVICLTIASYQLLVLPLFEIFISSSHTKDSHVGVIYYLGAILFGPILEELIFRGTILSGILENYTSQKAILLSTVLFALIHGTLLQIIPAFFWGLLLGYTFYKTRSILLCIILHVTVNISGLISDILTPDNRITQSQACGNYFWTVYLISTIVFILGGIYLFGKQQGLQKYMQCYYQH